MSAVIGVLGAHDVTPGIAAVVREQPGTLAVDLPYADDADVPEIVRAHSADVDGWMFASVVPYTQALAAGLLGSDDGPASATSVPATYVEYTGPGLTQALLEISQRGDDIARVSIDTLAVGDVRHTYADVGVPMDGVHVLPHGPDTDPREVIDFHRRCRAASPATDIAITCVSAVHEAITPELPVYRLTPLTTSVQVAIRRLLLAVSHQVEEDAQVAIGMIQLSGDDTGLVAEAAALGGSVSQAAGGAHLLVTTRGPLAAATAGFTSLPMLGRLADHHEQVRIGIGLGDTAAEAGIRARHALTRARMLGEVRAVLSLRDGTDMILDAPATAGGAEVSSLSVLARRTGISVPTLRALQELRVETGDAPITSHDVARHLAISARAARRVVQRLEMGGLAERAGQLNPGGAGRPLTVYRLSV